MRAVVYEHFGGTPEVREVPDPVPPADGVVVEVAASGLCRSDWHAWAGHDPGVRVPHVPGHELCGVVAAVGSEVSLWRPGARVTTPFVCGCGRCAWCRSGDAQVCPEQTQPGFTHAGSFAQYVAVHAADTNLVGVPDTVGDAAAATLGCRFATAYRALTARAGLRPGEWLCVVGAGGVGLSAVMIGVALGARVVAVDPSPGARGLAAQLGAEHVVAAGDDVAARVCDLTGGGAHVAVDAVGSVAACADGIWSLRRRGRHVQVGLLPATQGAAPVPMERVIGWELDVLGSHGMPAADYPELLALVADDTLSPQRLLERTVGLEEAARLLPGLGSASPTGITVLDPRLG